ncbi:protease modulator HflK [Fontisphaera persica]|uniref:protease modulator HflK n=1 Tax=Fontisphaera persica TaxID=2974023 RepID=UPI0024BF55EF|nr:protease modulator HflK [Fontisphaera persica]WCJ59190.1 protease modulator HflK [Fontisphaera persica]
MERQLRTNATVNTVVLLLAAVVTFAMGRYSGSAAGQVVAVFLAIGFVAALVSRFQMGLEESERLEQLELEELARKATDSALFKTAEAELRPARRAREQFEKYFGPGVAVVLLAAQWGGAWGLWQWLSSPARKLEEPTGGVLEHAGVALAIYGGVGLILFLFGKVAANLVQITRQRLLRPAAGYVLLGAYWCGLVAAGVGADIAGYPRVDGWMARALVLALAVAGVENALTLILEIYRPRLKGAERRLLYESRLVGLASQPEGIFTTVAHALDYQFGFKVSETWFYQFLQKYLGLFLLAQLGLLLLSTCVVFIEPGEQAILERFGRPLPRLLDAGGHWKWPWPVDKVYRYRTDRIQTFSIGHSPHEEEEAADSHGHDHGREAKRPSAEPEAILWTEAHAKDEFNLLVASREEGEGDREAGQAVPVNLLAVDLPVQYQVTNLLMWATRYSDGAALLERVATREVVQYLVHADLNEILTTGRQRTAEELRARIQERANELQMGVRILFVGLQNIHPPVRIAPAYQAVVAALQEKEAKILEAEGYAAQTLPQARAEAVKRKVAAEIYALRRAADAQAQAIRFTNQLQAWKTAPQVFATRGYLQALVRGGAESRKLVLAATNTDDVIQFNLEDKLRPGIDDVVLPPPKTPSTGK